MKRTNLFCLLGVGLLAVALAAVTIGCGNISESRACRMVEKHLQQREKNGEIKGLEFHGCSNFKSRVNNGWAKISAEAVYHRQDTFSGWSKRPFKMNLSFTFRRTDQGWEIH